MHLRMLTMRSFRFSVQLQSLLLTMRLFWFLEQLQSLLLYYIEPAIMSAYHALIQVFSAVAISTILYSARNHVCLPCAHFDFQYSNERIEGLYCCIRCFTCGYISYNAAIQYTNERILSRWPHYEEVMRSCSS